MMNEEDDHPIPYMYIDDVWICVLVGGVLQCVNHNCLCFIIV